MDEHLGDTGLETLDQVDVVVHPAGRRHIFTRRKYGVGDGSPGIIWLILG